MNYWRAAIICLAATLSSSCVGPLNRQMVRSQNPVFADDPSRPDLALLEYRIATSVGQAMTADATVCAGIVDTSSPITASIHTPSALAAAEEAALLARYERLSPLSACKWDGTAYRDTTNGAAAIVFDVHDIRCEHSTLCEGYVGFNRDAKINGWSFYEIRFDEYWRIRRKDVDIILTGFDRSSTRASS